MREVNNQKEELPVAFLEILEANFYHLFLSLDEFIAWHSVCRFLRRFLKDGFFGKYTAEFCRIAILKNDSLLKIQKHGTFYLQIRRLIYLKSIQETVDSIMGPVVFGVDQMENGMMISCTLEAIGYTEDMSKEKKKELYQIFIKAISYIKESYGWELGILRGKQRYLIPDASDCHFLNYKDQCALFITKPLPQVKPQGEPQTRTIKSTPYKPVEMARDPGCRIF